MENKRKYIKGIIIPLALVLCLISSVFAFASNEYEYNDVQIYVNNVNRTTVALRSNSVIGTGVSTYFEVFVNSSGYLTLKMATGESIATSIELTSVSQVSATQNGNSLSVGYVNGAFRVAFTTDSYYLPIKLSINGSSTRLDAPTVTFADNVLSWNAVPNASGYNIQYAETDSGEFTTLVTNYPGTSYTINQSGKYTVQAYGTGSYTSSTWSTPITCTYDSSVDDTSSGLLGRINEIIQNVEMFFNNIENLVDEAGNVFNALIGFLPPAYSAVLWSLAGVLLLFGLFRLL